MSNRKLYISLLSVLILTLLLAVHNRFIQDDAFISFRYAQNMVEGNGLVFNAGERVEGYTNFLWTILLSLSFLVKVNPIYFSWMLGLFLFPCSIYLTYSIGTALSHKKEVGLIAALLTGANYTYSAYATGGLETHAQSFMFLAITLLLIKIREQATFTRLLLFSISTTAAFLIRMDSAIIIAPALFVLLINLLKSKNSKKISQLSIMTLPAMAIAGTWLIWKFFYYGHILPNTFFIKTSAHGFIPGLYYICLYLFSYGLFLMFPATVLLIMKNKSRPDWNTGFILATSVLWLLYIVKIGGGFMEFRLMVPIIPFVFILIGWSIYNISKRSAVRTAWILLFCGISLFHSQRNRLYGVETVRGLERHVCGDGWIAAGKSLKKYFGNTDIVISTTAAGAMPFYSELTTIDMLGLNDKWIARNGLTSKSPSRQWLGEKPGHQKKAPLDYLLKRNVNLLFGHPQIMPPASKTYTRTNFTGDAFYQLNEPPPQNTQVLEIPMNDQAVLIALYIRKHFAIESAINEMRWRVYPLN